MTDSAKYKGNGELLISMDEGEKLQDTFSGVDLSIFEVQQHEEGSNTWTFYDTTMCFDDVVVGSWYEEHVDWAVENGITAGAGSPTTFLPNKICGRAEIVTFLWRAYGSPEPATTENPFVDIDPVRDSWFYKPVLWAVEERITSGIGNGMFNPMGKCSRAEIVTFLHRAME